MRTSLLHGMLLAVLALLIYSNTFGVAFQFDDVLNLSDNSVIRSLDAFFNRSPESGFKVHHAPSFSVRYIGYLTFALNYGVHGLDVAGYHAVNLAVHIANALLVYGLVLLTFRAPFFEGRVRQGDPHTIALCASLLFTVHPLQTQAVTYIIQRFASLATLFYLLSLVLYIKARLAVQRAGAGRKKTEDGLAAGQTTGRRSKTFPLPAVPWYLASLLLAVLAMKTKEISFTLPLMAVVYEFLFFTGPARKRLLVLLPLLLTLIIIPASLISERNSGDLLGDVSEVTRDHAAVSRGEYLLTQFRVIVTYLRLLVLPIDQNLDYDYPVSRSFFDPAVLASFLLLASLAGLGLFLLFRSSRTSPDLRVAAFGIFWFFITLAVESSVIPIADVIFEHRVYLPSVGAFSAAATAVVVLARQVRFRQPWAGRAVLGVFIAAALALAAAAYARNKVWQDEVSLWQDVAEKSPNKARGHYKLGNAYYQRNEIVKAIDEMNQAIRLNLDYPPVHFDLGTAYTKAGMFDDAIRELQIMIAYNSRYAEAYNALGLAYGMKGRPDKAVAHFATAILLNPRLASAYNNLGTALSKTGRSVDAIRNYERAIALDPGLIEAKENLRKVAAAQKEKSTRR